jgi:osmotically-inducible protein OsmY
MKANLPDDMLENIVAGLERDTRVNVHRSPITVRAEDCEVILEGQVDSIAEKRAAVDTATRTLSGLARWPVVDRIHVEPADYKEDLELKEAVSLALSDEPVFRDYTLLTKVADNIETLRDKGPGNNEIMTTIEDGCITLSGQVESLSHRRLAEVLMWWTNGCQYVDNLLEVVPPERDTDNEITDALRIVLEKDPLVHAGQLLVVTAGGVVVMNGSLASEEEKKLAILDAWCVPGVTDVVDRIETRD